MYEENWKIIGQEASGRQESYPYTKCPHCNLFKFRKVRSGHYENETLAGFFLRNMQWTWDKPHRGYCSNCQYEEIYYERK